MIVVDTNVLISALYSSKGASYRLLDLCLDQKIEHATSPLILFEYLGKVSDKISEGLLSLKYESYLVILKRFMESSVLISQPVLNRPTLPDEADDKFLECGISSNATHIITYNLRDFPKSILTPIGLQVATPKEYLKKRGFI